MDKGKKRPYLIQVHNHDTNSSSKKGFLDSEPERSKFIIMTQKCISTNYNSNGIESFLRNRMGKIGQRKENVRPFGKGVLDSAIFINHETSNNF